MIPRGINAREFAVYVKLGMTPIDAIRTATVRAANFALDLAGFRLLGLDSVRRPFVHGQFGAAQLSWLDGELRQTGLPVLLFVHHPPIRIGCWWLDKDRLRDRRRLEAMLHGGNVQAIACGHVHQPCEGIFAGVPVWTAPAVAYPFEPRARWPGAMAAFGTGYRCIELRGGTVATHVVQHSVRGRALLRR